jgi:CheY-like chemotaxis protein
MPKVLVIDDIDETRKIICKILERNNYLVVEARNGVEGLKMFEQEKPDVVVTDILMPDMEGLETIQKMFKIKPKLPIIAITASMDTPYLQIALKLGAVCGLYKPFGQVELLDAMNKALTKLN